MLTRIAQACRIGRAALHCGRRWATTVVNRRIPLRSIKRGNGTLGLNVEPYEGTLQANRDEWLLEAHRHAVELSRLPDVSMTVLENGELEVQTAKFTIRATRAEELLILREVLCDRVYNFVSSNALGVIDIGMNVGISSLYFAAELHAQVVGYELVPDTYKLAIQNFEANPSLKHLVTPVMNGVGATARSVKVNFTPLHRGIATICARSDSAKNVYDGQIDAQVVAIEDVVIDARNRFGSKELVIKMDCEGAEYEIFERLCSSQAIYEIRHFMVEWHQFSEGQKTESVVNQLKSAGFGVSVFGHPHDLAGMLYATR